jgi:hypothetical protein
MSNVHWTDQFSECHKFIISLMQKIFKNLIEPINSFKRIIEYLGDEALKFDEDLLAPFNLSEF